MAAYILVDINMILFQPCMTNRVTVFGFFLFVSKYYVNVIIAFYSEVITYKWTWDQLPVLFPGPAENVW